MEIKSILLSSIRVDGGTQSRASLYQNAIDDYAAAIQDGASFPPIIVFYDGKHHWLADGFHRFNAHRQIDRMEIDAEVRQGTRRDAILHSVGANASHGLRRSNDDKRRAVLTLLNDAEWSKWSDREIARRCAVSDKTVASLRPVTSEIRSEERTYTTKHGTVATMNTAAIGKPKVIENDAGDSDQYDPWTPRTIAPAEQIEQAQAKAERQAQQAEFDRQREEHTAALPPEIQAIEAAKKSAIETRKSKPAEIGLTDADRIAELEEAVRVLEAENAKLTAENKLYGEMRVQFEQGGFENVIAGKDEEIRALQTRLYRESEDKASWMRSAKYWQDEAKKLGYSRNTVIDLETGEIIDG
ncbi:hypothetical protein C7441_12533 [Pseudaminobacter salicylatoxidans]|uniref:ParB-like N-terminal domain-containing protein n=1 Tax=Pseudaminobacter salicylatoxidans TaxID=93369 RepID=A0A316BMY6_PSESE|nr:hypothetical protein [Pseudaminobacter salicylatoxidans]PWJ73849.1 hypothetical protein C7441_12533 [Pseudaminobacter salicylatoxidans]